jgi:hypothetical protein
VAIPCARPALGEVESKILVGMGDGDANGVDTDDEWIYGDSGVLKLMLGVSPPFRNRFSKEYLDAGLRVGKRGGRALRPAPPSAVSSSW